MVAKTLLGMALVVAAFSATGSPKAAEATKPTARRPAATLVTSTGTAGATSKLAKKKTGIHPDGYYWVSFVDEECPDSPDTFWRLIHYRDENYNDYGTQFGGRSTYWCNGYYKMATYETPYYECQNSEYGCVMMY